MTLLTMTRRFYNKLVSEESLVLLELGNWFWFVELHLHLHLICFAVLYYGLEISKISKFLQLYDVYQFTCAECSAAILVKTSTTWKLELKNIQGNIKTRTYSNTIRMHNVHKLVILIVLTSLIVIILISGFRSFSFKEAMSIF